MKDLTQGSMPRLIIAMAVPIAFSMLIQNLYYLVDLYYVSQLGEAALAGVSAAGNLTFFIMALTQILGVGTVTLVAQAVGRRDRDDAQLIFNQSLVLSAALAAITVMCGYLLSKAYVYGIVDDPLSRDSGIEYLYWVTPGLAGQFALVAMGSALRGTGLVKPTVIVQFITVVINILLVPVLVDGRLTGHPMGVAGAGLATSIAVLLGVVLLGVYFHALEKYVSFDPALFKPRWVTWRRMLAIGLPAGGEFFMMFFYLAFIYWLIQDFGAAAQAGFGLGSRVIQALFLPALAVAFALPAIVGQNFGAGQHRRVAVAFTWGIFMVMIIMGAMTLLCQWWPEPMAAFFSEDADTVGVAVEFMQFVSLNFIASGIIMATSGMFQGLGNTWPALYSSAARLMLFFVPAWWLSTHGAFELRQLWTLAVLSAYLQMGFALFLLRGQFRKKLRIDAAMDPLN